MIEHKFIDKSILFCLGKPKHDDCAIIDLCFNKLAGDTFTRQFTLAGQQ